MIIVSITILNNKMEAWMKSDAAKRKEDEVRKKAWNDFKLRYPNADLSQFHVEIEMNGVNDVTGIVQIKERPGYWSDAKYFTEKKKKALGIGGFSKELI